MIAKLFRNNNPQPALSRGAHLSYCRQCTGRFQTCPYRLLLLLALLTATFPAFAQTPNLTVCAGKGYTLTSNVEATGASEVTYEWYESVDGATAVPIDNSNTASYSFAAGKAEAGTYAYVRKASNAECPGGVFSNTYTVVVYAIPTITTQPAATSTCSGGTVTLSVVANNATAWQWLDNTGAAVTGGSGGQSATYTTDPLNTITTFSVVVSNTLAACSITSDPAVVTVYTPPAAPTGATSYTGCVAGYAAFSVDKPEDGITIDWYADATGGTPIASETNTMIRNLSVGAYTFYAEARDKTTGCVSAVRVAAAITINAEPDAPTGASANARCGSGTVTFSAAVPDGITIDWYDDPISGSIVGGGSSVTSFAPDINESTTYYAQARNTTTGCVSATRLAVGGTVMDKPARPTLTKTTGTVCAGSYIYFYASGGSGTYVWSGNVTGSGATVTSNSTAAGNYTATVSSTGVTCNSSSTSTTGTISAPAAVGATDVGCGCNGGKNCFGTCIGQYTTCIVPKCSTASGGTLVSTMTNVQSTFCIDYWRDCVPLCDINQYTCGYSAGNFTTGYCDCYCK